MRRDGRVVEGSGGLGACAVGEFGIVWPVSPPPDPWFPRSPLVGRAAARCEGWIMGRGGGRRARGGAERDPREGVNALAEKQEVERPLEGGGAGQEFRTLMDIMGIECKRCVIDLDSRLINQVPPAPGNKIKSPEAKRASSVCCCYLSDDLKSKV